jgi:hypothetical protein
MLSVIEELVRLGALLALVVFVVFGVFAMRHNQKLRLWKRQISNRLRF